MAPTNIITPQTPVNLSNQVINDLLRQLHANTTATPGNNTTSTAAVTGEQLHALLQCFRDQQATSYD